MACQECKDSVLNPTPLSLCTDCPPSCASQFDTDCVVYHPNNDVLSNLRNLGLPNNQSVTTILEKIDFLIGQNFNINLTVVQSNSITLTATGPALHTLKADVKISPDAGNRLVLHANGLYVA